MIVILCLSTKAQSFRFSESFEKVKNARKNATLLLSVYDKNSKLVNITSAFFIGKDGHFMTTYHSIEKHLKDIQNGNATVFVSKPKMRLNFGVSKVIKCSQKRTKIDLCLLKVDPKYKIKNYFPINDFRKIKVGETYNPNIGDDHKFFSFGHPGKERFVEIQSRLVKHYNNARGELQCSRQSHYKETKNLHISEIEVIETSEKKYTYGHSGSPVFDNKGKLVGMLRGRIAKYDSRCRLTKDKAVVIIPAKYLYSYFYES